ncbi:alpha/beta-hydrolase family protein [Actinomycetospora sp. C-140]
MSRDRRWWHVDPAGLLVATAAAVLALGPGLLPRDGVTQGVVSGVVAALGYGLGATVSVLLRRGGVRPRRRPGVWLPVVAVGVLVAAVGVAAGGQQQAAALIGATPPSTAAFLLGVPVTVAVVALLVAVARGLRRSTGLLRRRLPGPAVVATVALATLVVAGVATSVGLTVTEAAFRARNDEPGAIGGPPARAARSGSPTSLVGWDTLGRDGRRFVAGGRSADQLAAASGRAPRDPVRVYVGLESAPDPARRAALAVAELDRAGALDRSVLALVTPTGSGSVDPQIPDALELVRGGDTAVAAVQYSTLPSDLSFLVDGPEARASTAALLDAVRARLAQRPPDRRPRLLVFGQSLGSLGSQAAFGSLDDARARADGVLWVGPPHGSEPWTGLVARRDPGTPEVLPVVDGGRAVRFAGRPADLAGGPPWAPWQEPRVLYLQHPSDPVVWWSPDLLWHRPDRFSEPAGSDVPAGQRWYPVITFWQTTVDLARAQSLTPDHGHRYDALLVDGWAAVAPPPGWTDADTDRARQVFAG